MRARGTRRSRKRALGDATARAFWALVASALLAPADLAAAQVIETPLTAVPGDPARGRAIVADQFKGLCILCHSGPFPEHRFMGALAPPLDGVGSRLTAPELRARIVDSRKMNPDTIMPPYHATDGLNRVGPDWRDKTIFTAQEVEDVVAFLATLTEEAP